MIGKRIDITAVGKLNPHKEPHVLLLATVLQKYTIFNRENQLKPINKKFNKW